MAEPHQLGQARHRDEDDGGGLGAAGRHQGARADRVLGQQDHLLLRPPLLPQGLLLDIQVTRKYRQLLTINRRSCTIMEKAPG